MIITQANKKMYTRTWWSPSNMDSPKITCGMVENSLTLACSASMGIYGWLIKRGTVNTQNSSVTFFTNMTTSKEEGRSPTYSTKLPLGGC
jgi:hypothetical protein